VKKVKNLGVWTHRKHILLEVPLFWQQPKDIPQNKYIYLIGGRSPCSVVGSKEVVEWFLSKAFLSGSAMSRTSHQLHHKLIISVIQT
jgi:hypothetical protein